MTDYIRAIQRRLIDLHGFKENPDAPGLPMDVPDGEYPMVIDGRLDNVRVVSGMIWCCNFAPAAEGCP